MDQIEITSSGLSLSSYGKLLSDTLFGMVGNGLSIRLRLSNLGGKGGGSSSSELLSSSVSMVLFADELCNSSEELKFCNFK